MLCRSCAALEIAVHHEIHNCETPSWNETQRK
jgi:hypothetical protein